jgi:hypothetical protein
MLSNKMNRAVRNHRKCHKRLVSFIGHAGLVATASVCMPLAWGQMVGAQQQPAKDLSITPKLLAANGLLKIVLELRQPPFPISKILLSLSAARQPLLASERLLATPAAVANL